MRRLALPLAAIVLALTACSPKTVVVPEDRSGSSVTIEPSQELRVELQENASVGWTWEVTTDPDAAVLAFIGRDYEPDSPDTEGGGGTVRFRWKGASEGTTELTISRDFRGEGVDKTFELTVTVATPE